MVRIRSQQTLTRWKDGVLVPGTGEPKECQEYVVIQKRLWKGKEEGWMVWGTVQETTMEEVLEAERQLA